MQLLDCAYQFLAKAFRFLWDQKGLNPLLVLWTKRPVPFADGSHSYPRFEVMKCVASVSWELGSDTYPTWRPGSLDQSPIRRAQEPWNNFPIPEPTKR